MMKNHFEFRIMMQGVIFLKERRNHSKLSLVLRLEPTLLHGPCALGII